MVVKKFLGEVKVVKNAKFPKFDMRRKNVNCLTFCEKCGAQGIYRNRASARRLFKCKCKEDK